MISTRESIGAALFALVQKLTGISNAQRSYIDAMTLGTSNLPALELVEKRERAEFRGTGLPVKWTLVYYLYLFASTSPNPGEDGAETILNNLLDTIEKSIGPSVPTGIQTLGGLVYDVRVNGEIVREPGFASGIGAAAIPIEVTTTS
jgi:hypothetical protein